MEGVKYAIDQLKSTYNKNNIPQLSDTCKTIVFWVINELMTRQYSLWHLEPVSKQHNISEAVFKEFLSFRVRSFVGGELLVSKFS